MILGLVLINLETDVHELHVTGLQNSQSGQGHQQLGTERLVHFPLPHWPL